MATPAQGLTISDLGKRVKAKYPGTYDDLADDEVGRKVQSKFPGSYDDFKTPEPVPDKPGVLSTLATAAQTPMAEAVRNVLPSKLQSSTPPPTGAQVFAPYTELAAKGVREVGEPFKHTPGVPSVMDFLETALKKGGDLAGGVMDFITSPLGLATLPLSAAHPLVAGALKSVFQGQAGAAAIPAVTKFAQDPSGSNLGEAAVDVAAAVLPLKGEVHPALVSLKESMPTAQGVKAGAKAAISAATSPTARDIAGVVSPRVAHAIDLVNRGKRAVGAFTGPAAPAAAAPASPAPPQTHADLVKTIRTTLDSVAAGQSEPAALNQHTRVPVLSDDALVSLKAFVGSPAWDSVRPSTKQQLASAIARGSKAASDFQVKQIGREIEAAQKKAQPKVIEESKQQSLTEQAPAASSEEVIPKAEPPAVAVPEAAGATEVTNAQAPQQSGVESGVAEVPALPESGINGVASPTTEPGVRPLPEVDSGKDNAPAQGEPQDGLAAAPELYQQAIAHVRELGKASTSALQRKFRVGYGAAQDILSRMEADGIVGPADGSKPREVIQEPNKFASTQVNLPETHKKAFEAATKTIADEDLAKDGRETEGHITLKYGLHDEAPEAVKKLLADEGPITAKIGKTSIFPAKEASSQRGGEQYDVVKMDVDSPDLHRLNKKIAELPHTDTHPNYTPHVTLSYVKAGEGAKYAGKDIPGLTGQEIKFNEVRFSDKGQNHTKIPLQEKSNLEKPGEAPKEPTGGEFTDIWRALEGVAKERGLNHGQLSDVVKMRHGVETSRDTTLAQRRALYKDWTGEDFDIRSATKAAKALHDAGITAEDAAAMGDEHWKMAAEGTGIENPQAIQGQIVQAMKALEKQKASGKAPAKPAGKAQARTEETPLAVQQEMPPLSDDPVQIRAALSSKKTMGLTAQQLAKALGTSSEPATANILKLGPTAKTQLAESIVRLDAIKPELTQALVKGLENGDWSTVNQSISEMRRQVRATPDIPKGKNLTPEQQAIEERFRAKIKANPQAAVDEYVSKNTRPNGTVVINTDEARELSPDYVKDRSQSAAVHEPSSWLSKKAYDLELAKPAPEGTTNTVAFTGGGTGAGKSSASSRLTGHNAPQILYDTNLNKFDSAVEKIDAALKAGKDIRIVYVHSLPEAAFGRMLARAMRMGRTVPLSEHINTHVGGPKTLLQLAEKYKTDPRVGIEVVDNSGERGLGKFVDIKTLRGLDYHGLNEKLTKQLEEKRASGEISETVYRGVKGTVPSGRSEPSRADDPEHPGVGVQGPGRGSDSARYGSGTEILVPGSNDSYPAKYSVRELADVQPSHSGINFEPNSKFELLNDRNYSDKRNSGRILDQAANFKPAYVLTDAPDALNGAPIIDTNGNVLGGNSRAMSIERVYKYHPEGAKQYVEQLNQRAKNLGLDPEQLKGMKQPVLVRELTGPLNKAQSQKAITQFNQSGTASLTAGERAIADSRRVSPKTLDEFSRRIEALGPDATLAQALAGNARDLVNRLVDDGAVTKQEVSQMVNPDGTLTAEGKTRTGRLLIGRFFDDAKEFDTTPADVRNKLERISGSVAATQGLGEWDIAEPVKKGVRLLNESKMRDVPIDDLLAQQGMFEDAQYDPRAVDLAKTMQKKPTEAARAFRQYATDANLGNSKQNLLAGMGEPPTPEVAFQEAFGR